MSVVTTPAPPRAGTRRLGLLALAVLVMVVAVRWLVLEPVRVATESMVPTLQPGDRVLVERVSDALRDWHVGDVVLFRAPDGELMVKRVVALGGESVEIRDGRLVVAGETVDEPYAAPDRIDSVYFGPEQVPERSVFVMGDNRANSVDSRSFGPVPESEILGRVVAVWWPLGSAGPVT